jgi:hypothetical protein
MVIRGEPRHKPCDLSAPGRIRTADHPVRSEVYRALDYSITLITCAHPVVPQIAEIWANKPLKAMIRGISMAQHERPDSVRIRPSRMQLRQSS